MITLVPLNFVWPQFNNREHQQIQWDDYQVSEIIEFLIGSMSVDKSVQVYADPRRYQNLIPQQTLSQQGLQQNCSIYLFINETQSEQPDIQIKDEDNLVIQVVIDQIPQDKQFTVSKASKASDIIQNEFSNLKISKIEIRDNNHNLLSNNSKAQFSTINPQLKSILLCLFTQQSEKLEIIKQVSNDGSEKTSKTVQSQKQKGYQLKLKNPNKWILYFDNQEQQLYEYLPQFNKVNELLNEVDLDGFNIDAIQIQDQNHHYITSDINMTLNPNQIYHIYLYSQDEYTENRLRFYKNGKSMGITIEIRKNDTLHKILSNLQDLGLIKNMNADVQIQNINDGEVIIVNRHALLETQLNGIYKLQINE